MGYRFVRAHRIKAHRRAMITAFAFSTLFLVSYVGNYALHGESHYPGHSVVRIVYLTILVSHVLFSMVALPLVLRYFLFLSDRTHPHRSQGGSLDVSHLALRVGHRDYRVCHVGCRERIRAHDGAPTNIRTQSSSSAGRRHAPTFAVGRLDGRRGAPLHPPAGCRCSAATRATAPARMPAGSRSSLPSCACPSAGCC